MLIRLMLALYFTQSYLHAFTFKPLYHRTAARIVLMSSQGVGLSEIGRTDSTPSSDVSTSWKKLLDVSIAKSRKTRGSNFVQIATVDEASMEPRCRTVVFRGFQNTLGGALTRVMGDGTSCVMKMITDNRSNKVQESRACEMVWWFSKTSEQYRIRGMLEYVGGGSTEDDSDKLLKSARKEQWGNLSDSAREQFFWQDPGIGYSGISTVPVGGRDDEGTLLPPPESFLLMFLIPHRVDYLRLGDNYRQLDQWEDGVWSSKRLNP